MATLKPLVFLSGCSAGFVSDLFRNLKDRFSCDAAQMILLFYCYQVAPLLSSGAIAVKWFPCRQVVPLLPNGFIAVNWFHCHQVVPLLSSDSIAVKWFHRCQVVPLM